MALSPERLEARRRNLVNAAHQLVRETGGAGFSMLQLAKRAGVSPATPYNLLGTKSEVLRRVIHDEFECFAARLAGEAPRPPLAHLLHAVDLVAVHYTDEPDFYRGLYHAVLDTQASELRSMMSAEGQLLWCDMVRAALAAGELEPVIAAEALTDLLLRMMGATVEAWLAESWDPPRFAREMVRASRVLLLGLASPARRAELLAEL